MKSAKIKWGIIGLGKISTKFASDLRLVSDGHLSAVASRDLMKAQSFAKQFEADSAFGSYDEMIKSADLDIVYIGTPHTFHKEHSLLCLRHGIGVLCEKPATLNSNELQEVISAARVNKSFYMEALWTRFLPSMKQVLQIVEDGELGEVLSVEAEFCFTAPVDFSSRLYDMHLGGGSILDIGIYPVFLAYLLMGVPNEVEASAQLSTTGADQTATIRFSYLHKKQAVLHSSILYDSQMPARITLTRGYILIQPRWHESSSLIVLKAGEEAEIIACPPKGKGYTHEIEECHRCLREGVIESSSWSHQNSTELLKILDLIRAQAGVYYPAEKSV